MSRRWLDPEAASDIGRLDPEAIERVRAEAWPDPENADELHDALAWLGFLSAEEAASRWRDWLAALAAQNRVDPPAPAPGADIWIAAERLPQFQALWPEAQADPAIAAPADYADRDWSRRGGAGRNSARPAGGLRPGDAGRVGGAAGPRAGRNRAGAGGAASRGLCDARAVHRRRQCRRMVRPAAARAHPSLYRQAPARRDRAGRRARLPAVPVRLAARVGR